MDLNTHRVGKWGVDEFVQLNGPSVQSGQGSLMIQARFGEMRLQPFWRGVELRPHHSSPNIVSNIIP